MFEIYRGQCEQSARQTSVQTASKWSSVVTFETSEDL